ncbi:MAG: type IV pilus twitching motility protein PilT, partial [bacterium]
AGSGKSTTLAAMIDYINHYRRLHVVCIEDPIEYLHSHHSSVVEQREIGDDARSFSEALRSVFRQSPDVIMVGEMRDLETMQLVLSLAETGHLILATLHTQDSTHAINRIVDSFPPQQQQQIYTQLSLVLVGVVSQQLIVRKDGTARVLACEVMNVNNAIRNMIREMQVQQLYSVIETGRSDNMMTMNDSLVRLCEADLIDVDVAVGRSLRPKEMVKLMECRTQSKRRQS